MKEIILLYLLLFSVGLPSISMEGIYEGQFGKTYESDAFEWNMWDTNYYLETRLYGNPIHNSDFYIKFYADKDYAQSEQALAVFSEGHIGFRQDKDENGFSTILFTRESRHYWLDGSILGMVNTGSVNNDGNGQGMRFDFWHNYNGSMTYVFSDYSQGGGDDIHLIRYRQSLLKNKINTGLFFQRKHFPTGNLQDYNQVIAHDLKIHAGRYYFTSEIAISNVPSDSSITDLNDDYQSKDFFKSNVAIKSELKGLRIGSPKSGYWFFTPGVFSYGNTYRNYMGDNQSNRYGYWLNSYYLVPQRAITLTLNYNQSQKLVADTIAVFSESLYSKGIFDPTMNIYAEVYIEFVNGFKGKIVFNKKDEKWQGQLYKHYDFFSEISVENSLAKLLGQFKIKDLGETWEKHIAGIELSVNLTDKWRFFTRGMIADDRVGSRFSIFTELQYRMSGNTELYLQYGPSYWGQYGLVNDDGFASSGMKKKEVKLILKGWF
jgi:hypothetical protein